MIKYTRKTLDNGLKLIIHRDTSTPMAAINLLYDVGSRDENEAKTGSAHLLEHLLFGGTLNIPSYDKEVQKAGGENNAFTSNDITNYYIQLPAVNLETGFWLESDRMTGLQFTQKTFDIQKSVVIEEYKQRYLNQPYGDIWLLLRPLAYKKHPYKWPVIGTDISHIESMTLPDIEDFYNEHYCPSNAILTVAGNIKEDFCLELADKWFGNIARRKRKRRNLPVEPGQTKARIKEVNRNVPFHEIIIAYHMSSRGTRDYYSADLISDILAGGKSSRFYKELVKEKRVFSNLDAYITGDRDPGLFIVKGRLDEMTEMKKAHKEILRMLDIMSDTLPDNRELDKVKNRLEATKQYTHTSILHKAIDLSYQELMGDAGNLNKETEIYRNIKREEIREAARSILNPINSSTLFYYSTKNKLRN
jgi:zinc protease